MSSSDLPIEPVQATPTWLRLLGKPPLRQWVWTWWGWGEGAEGHWHYVPATPPEPAAHDVGRRLADLEAIFMAQSAQRLTAHGPNKAQ